MIHLDWDKAIYPGDPQRLIEREYFGVCPICGQELTCHDCDPIDPNEHSWIGDVKTLNSKPANVACEKCFEFYEGE